MFRNHATDVSKSCDRCFEIMRQMLRNHAARRFGLMIGALTHIELVSLVLIEQVECVVDFGLDFGSLVALPLDELH